MSTTNTNSIAAATALSGGPTSSDYSGTHITEDGVEAAAIWAVVEVVCDGAGTKHFDRNATTGVITVGYLNIPGQQNFTSKWGPTTMDPNVGTWDGLQRR